jgi:UDP-glucose 4-epimerase
MSILVTGGAGYIGSHIVHDLVAMDYEVTVLDDLSTGLGSRIPPKVRFVEMDICSESSLFNLFRKNSFDTVIHLAGKKSVSESFLNFELYEKVNFLGTSNLLKSAEAFGVKNFIFSSTAAIYDGSSQTRVNELSPKIPISPYGVTKLRAENIIRESGNRSSMNTCSLRFFNVAGSGGVDLRDLGRTNLISIVFDQVSRGVRPIIFGEDYSTHDGTCIRDYVHVLDISHAHILALQKMSKEAFPTEINIGTGQGYSVKEVIFEILAATRSDLTPIIGERREGDFPNLIADNSLMLKTLGMLKPRGLREIVDSINV